MEIVVRGHVAYRRRNMNEVDEELLIEVQLVHLLPFRAQVDAILDDNQGHQVVPEDQHIMGMVRDEEDNITHRKVCSTNQCDLVDVFPKKKSFFVLSFCFAYTHT